MKMTIVKTMGIKVVSRAKYELDFSRFYYFKTYEPIKVNDEIIAHTSFGDILGKVILTIETLEELDNERLKAPLTSLGYCIKYDENRENKAYEN